MKVKNLLIIFLILLLSLLSVSCTNSNTNGTESESYAEEARQEIIIDKSYIITRPTKGDLEISLANALKADILTYTDNINISVAWDYLKSGKTAPEKEILIGKTERSESVDVYNGLAKNQWKICVKNSKIVIAGESGQSLTDALKYFTDNFIKSNSEIKIPYDTEVSGVSTLYNFSWKTSGTLIDTGIGGGYPRLYTLNDGTLLLGYDGMYVCRSTDNGMSWSEPIHASQNYIGTANAAFFQGEDGTVYLGFRSIGEQEDGSFYTSIQISYSTNGGKTWKHHSTVYENIEKSGAFKGVWEPHFGIMNGYLTCFYANDSTNVTSYQNIEYKQWDPESEEWINRTVVCNGEKHRSRDGMPVWQKLSTGEFICVIEAFDKDDNNCFAIKLCYSDDGTTWSEPVTVMRAKKKGTICAAPYVLELPTGQLIISCQTTEAGNPDYPQMATVISDGSPVKELSEDNFSEHDFPYYDSPENISTMWNGMHLHKNFLFTCSGSSNKGIRLNRVDLNSLLTK